MSLESWDWFLRLVEKGTFTRAAEELQIPQQTLSARLASLENELGGKLIDRTTPLTLTRAGEAFISYAREQEASRLRMLRQVSEVTIGGFGELKIGISNMRGRVLMPHIVKQFHRSMPGVRIKLIEGTNEELVHLVERSEADIVVASFGNVHPGVAVRPLYKEEIVLILDPQLLESIVGMEAEKAITAVEENGLSLLDNCPFLLETIDDISGSIARVELQKAGIKPKGLVESENMMTLLAMCEAGLGGVFCPTNMLDATADLTGRLARIHLSDEACYEIGIGTPASAQPWIPAQMFEDVIGALFADTH
ncbi:LysR family transcriptional regulator [Adlercreutzia sp. ZJ154]|uniref:LysR family transcriptional regulator n=1 Tax=Adlercreutzia sp. ZJ154 TaxID=2709790 RepID=UPI0013ED5956|nr:LysR family transcriptional regulator [Adlercreutzia sp. ZJ154]